MLVLVGSGFLFSLTGIIGKIGISRNNGLEWAEIGNRTILYDFAIFAGLTSEGIMDEWYPLNNSRIQTTIVTLPEIPAEITALWYIENIATIDKVQVSTENGTEIPFSLRIILEKLMSLMILPTSDWEFFDSHFSDSFRIMHSDGSYPTHYEYIGEMSDDTMYSFTRNWLQQQSGLGSYSSTSSGDIMKSMGIPECIYHHWLFKHADGFEYQIILTRHRMDPITIEIP